MQKPNDPGQYLIRTRRVIWYEAFTRITAPHAEAAMVAVQNNDDLPPKFRTVRVRITHDDVTKKGAHR